jgi:1-acyl-sn-glycerol-3-phosphate acyltransferase
VSLSQRLLVAMFRGLTHPIFRIHDEALERVPMRGPLIIVMNHINIFEIPIIYAHLQPRPVHGLVLADRWKNPLIGWGLDACGSIPLEQGGRNVDSLHRALDVLRSGEMLLIMPEGTRSGDGRLRPAFPGVVLLALKSKAPLLPVVSYGGEGYRQNLRRFRRTDFHLAVGAPFTLTETSDRSSRKELVDQIMFRLAALLPPEYRGVYAMQTTADDKS